MRPHQDTPPIRHRLRTAFRPAIGFALICVVLFGLAGAIGLSFKGFALFSRSLIALAVLTLPPALAAGLFAYAIDVLLPRRGAWLRGSVMLASLALFGPLASAGVFLLQYSYAYPIAHEPLWTETGFHQFAWTGIASIVLFGLHGMPLYWPWAVPAVLIAAIWFARRCIALSRREASAREPLNR